MTLLTICNAVADTTSGPRPSTIINNPNPEAQSYLRSANKVGKYLMKTYPWSMLRKEHTFTAGGTETLVAAASMPSDFDRFIPEAFWNRSNSVLLSGPVAAARWQSLKASSYSGDTIQFTLRGGDILATPTIGSGSSMAFEYVSNKYVQSSGGTGQTSFQADTDVCLIDEELVALAVTYDWLMSQGLPSQGAFNTFKEYFDMLTDNERASNNILATADIFSRDSRHWSGAPTASRSFLESA